MYDKRLDLYGSFYENPMDKIGQGMQQSEWHPSISAVLSHAKQQEVQQKPSNIPAIGSVRQALQSQSPQNNPSLGYLGEGGNWVSALTSGVNSFLANKNQKDAEDKQLLGQIIGALGKGASVL